MEGLGPIVPFVHVQGSPAGADGQDRSPVPSDAFIFTDQRDEIATDPFGIESGTAGAVPANP